MKLSDLKPCAICGGTLCNHPRSIQWYVLRVSSAMLNPGAVNRTMGLSQFFGGHLGVAEAMSPDANKAVLILGDEKEIGWVELHVCFDCYTSLKPMGEIAGAVDRESASRHPANPAPESSILTTGLATANEQIAIYERERGIE